MTANNKIRVICVFSTLNSGGSETMFLNLFRKIDKNRFQIDFVKHTKEEGLYEDEIKKSGSKIYTAPHITVLNYFFYKKWWNDFFKTNSDIDIIHGHFFTISPIYFSIAKKYGITTIGHIHSSPTNINSFKKVIKSVLAKRIEQKSDYCLACSKDAGEWIYKKKEYDVLTNAIDVDSFVFDNDVRKRVRLELGINEETIVAGTICNFTEPKNPIGTLQIINDLLSYNKKIFFIWIGDGKQRKEIEKKAIDSGIANHILFTGMVKNVNDILQAFDAFVLPSIWEGLPLSVVEAQASGTKCFLSDSITKEVDITDSCIYLSLTDYNLWAKSILEADLTKRNNKFAFENSNYNINYSVRWLEDYYSSIVLKKTTCKKK